MTDALRDQLQTTLGDAYVIERELGGGGMSRVFVVRDVRLARGIVIKVLSPELAMGLSAERFAREIRLAAALQEPHIVPVLSDGMMPDGLPFYTMPFVQGASLRERLQAGPMSTGEAASILCDVAKALSYAHGRGVVHRDIKPENILLSSGTAVVTDFGIAKAVQASRTLAPLGAQADGLTAAGTSLGTPAYMAPEQAAGDEVDARADIYAWGVIAYELLGGAHPFAGKTTAQQLIAAHMAQPAPPLVPLDARLSPTVTEIVMHCLAKAPADRPATAAELLHALEGTFDRTPLAPTVRTRYALAAAAVIGVALIAGWLTFSKQRNGASGDAPRSREPIMLAVLPFENIGADEQAIFTDGLSDAVTAKLSALSSLGVIDRRSAVQYRLSTKPAKQIGKELGVRYLVQGVVRWAKSTTGTWRAQVTPTLVNASAGVTEWTGTPTVITPDDPFTAQGTIATDVARAMEVQLAPQERERLAKRFTDNPQALAAYQRGLALMDEASRSRYESFKAGELQRAGVEFERAVQLDSNFAQAWGFLARQRVEEARLSPGNATAEERAALAVSQAMQRAPNDPMAMFGDVYFRLFFSRDTVGLAAIVDRAVSVAPNDATVLQLAGLSILGPQRYDSAYALITRAVTLDPRSSNVLFAAASMALNFREYDVARRRADALVELDSTDERGWALRVTIENVLGDSVAATAAAETAIKRLRIRSLHLENEISYVSLEYGRRFVTLSARDLNVATFFDSVAYYLDSKGDVFLRMSDQDRSRIYSDSVRRLFVGRALGADKPFLLTVLAFAQANVGRTAEARGTLDKALSSARAFDDSEYPFISVSQAPLVAGTYARIGDIPKAIQWLEAGLANPLSGLTMRALVQNPKLQILRGTPEFEAFLRAHRNASPRSSQRQGSRP